MSRERTVGLFLFTALVFGGAFPAVKAGLAFMPPLLFVGARSVLSGVLLLAFARVLRREDWWPRTRGDVVAVLAAGLFMVGGVGFGFVGQQFIASGVAAVIFSLSPVVTALLAYTLLPTERLGGRDYLAVLLGFVGVAVVVNPDPANLLDATVVGKLLVFVAVAVTALGAVLVRRSGTGLPASALTGWGMLLGSVVHVTVAVAVGESVTSVRPTPVAAAAVVYLAVVVGGVGFVAYLTLIDQVGPLRANLTAYVTPLVAITVGWVLLAESLQATTLVGFLVIVAGFALLERRELAAELARYRPLVR